MRTANRLLQSPVGWTAEKILSGPGNRAAAGPVYYGCDR